ncbi:MAG: FapA family protein, partial [Dehalococcoidales bacterium]|nr:FapA family protein [Dehalococcoidales bacterium]
MTSESSNLEGVVVPESATPDQAEPAEQTVELSVAVARDGTQALLTLHADPPEPYPFTLKAIVQTLNEHGVVEGILEEAIGQVVDNQEYVTDLLVAREIPPEEGEDARIDLLFDPFPKPAPAETPGHVDWREVKLIQTVIESQPIARKIPARTGTPGMTVTGKRIEPRKVRDVRLPAGRGTKVNENDPNELLAATPGAVRLANNQVVVDKVLTVPRDVDFSVGNIDFDGSVQIGG